MVYHGSENVAMGRLISHVLMPALLIASALVVIQGCESCGCGPDAPRVARVTSHQLLTETAILGRGWAKAEDDTWLHVDDSLRTDEQGRAELDLVGQGQVVVGPNSLVKFTALVGEERADPELRLSLEDGVLEAAVADGEALVLSIDSPAGRLRLAKGSKARVEVERSDRVKLKLLVGQAQLERGGQTRQVSAGASLVLGPESEAAGVPDGGTQGTKLAAAEPPPAPAEPTEEELAGAEGVALRPMDGARIEVRAPGQEEFTELGRGETRIEPGTVVRVSGGGSLEVSGPGGSSVVLHDGAEALVLGSREGRLRVALRGGRGTARSTGAGVASLSLPGGRVDTSAVTSLASLRATVLNRTSSRVNVDSGAAEIHTGGRIERAETGAEVVLRQGGEPRITTMRKVRPLIDGHGVIHDPQKVGSFTARFDPIEGCGTYSIQVSHGGRRHLAAVVSEPWLTLTDVPYGGYSWRATCLEAAEGGEVPSEAREGRVHRVADRSGSASLPTSAPRNTLDSNGRRYSVTYQNRLPAITLRWSKAPEAASYQLVVYDDAGGRRMYSGAAKRPAHSFPSGFFREGSYYWFFRAEGGERAASPVTKLRIAFDNVSPSIQIIEPREGAAASGSVRVRGVAAFGSSVTVNGVALDLGGDYRFDQQVPVGPGGLLIFRVSTPGRGTGVYLRHLGGS